MNEKKHVKFDGRLVFVGFGSVGQGTLPLILRHIDMPRERITILTGALVFVAGLVESLERAFGRDQKPSG